MSGFKDLKDLFRRRLLAAILRDLSSQTTDCECIEELNRQRNLLKVILTPEIKLQREDTEQLMMRKQKSLPEQQERSPSLNKEEPPEPAGIKKDQEDRCGSLERELNQGEEEDDINKMTFIHDKPHEGLNPLQSKGVVVSENTSVSSSECAPSLGQNEQHRHKQIQATGELLSCLVCGKKYKRLQLHMMRHSGEKPFSCSVCKKGFYTRQELRLHTQVHTGEKPFSCSGCGKRFSHQSNLKRHSSVHTGVKPFGCLVCSKMFSRRSDLRQHSVVHTGQKPFCCSDCGKGFSQRSDLKRHSSVHTGVKPFGCLVCGKMFSRKGNLMRHAAIHTGEKPFSCTFCS